MHGGDKQGTFPKDIKATVQYGKNLQALVIALNTVGAVSVNRTHEILSSVFNIPLATGTIKNMATRCAGLLSDTYYLSRLFKQELNTTFVEILTNIRICQAVRLLRETGLTGAEIAQKVGYASGTYFYRVFKKTVGITFGDLRKLA